MAIGIGVNCVHHPDGTDFPATDLASGRRPHLARKPVRAAVGRDGGAPRAMEPRRGLCRDPRRLARARRRASASRSACNSGDGELAGQFEGIDETGRLVLRLPDGTMQTVAAGDVFVSAARQ